MRITTLIFLVAIATAPTPTLAQETPPAPGLPDDCRLEATDLGMALLCGDGAVCGLKQMPVCWTVRWTCYWIGNPVAPTGIHCGTQPGCCTGTSFAGAEPQAAASGDDVGAPSQCNAKNYGVQVDPQLFYADCARSCENHGLWISVSFPQTACQGGCTSDGVEIRVGPSCRGALTAVCVEESCVSPCQSCPVGTAFEISYWGDCAVVVVFPGSPTSCDPCSESNPPILVVGVVQCRSNCVNSFVHASVGLLDCAACGNEGISIWIGQRCSDWGAGLCVGYHPCIGTHRDLPYTNGRPTGVN